MKNTFFWLSTVAVLLCLSIGSTAHAGKIVVANDEWTLSETGFSGANDPAQFATNVASWFNNGAPGSYLAYSSNFGLTGSSLAGAMTGAGNSWTVSTAVSVTLADLLAYDGVFLAGNSVDNTVLIDYVNAGGNVYLAGGTGLGGAAAEAALWESFLTSFGLAFGTSYNGVAGNMAIASTHPIFNGVDSLYQNNGNSVLDLLAGDPRGQVLVSYNGNGLYGVYDSGSSIPDPAAVPEPSTLILLGAGIAGVAWMKRRRKL